MFDFSDQTQISYLQVRVPIPIRWRNGFRLIELIFLIPILFLFFRFMKH